MTISRRSFIHAAGVVGLGVSTGFANIIIPQKKKLGVALVGLGYYAGDLLAPALQITQNCELKGVVTGSPWKIPVWQKRYNLKDGNIYNYDNMHEIANNPDIDVIYIVLPTGLHAKYAIIAANTGKHVWCEKPMARTAQECQQIIDACNKNKVKLSIGYRMQHEPKTRELIKWADSKPYGKILNLSANAGYYDGRSDHWKQNKALGGGAMYDMGVYPLNAARYISGEEPISVSARHENVRKDIYTEVDETTYFTLNFPSGAVANCSTSLGKGMNDLKVNCENGWYGLSPFQSYGGIRETTSDGRTIVPTVRNQQARQMDDDALAILNNKDVLVPGEEGMTDITIVETIYESAKSGKTISL